MTARCLLPGFTATVPVLILAALCLAAAAASAVADNYTAAMAFFVMTVVVGLIALFLSRRHSGRHFQ